MIQLTRRALLLASLVLAATPLLPHASAQAQDALALASSLGDRVQGAENAKVTVIEYASLTCSHCATFHKEGYPHLKTNYIDTGKVRYIYREFPLDQRAVGAAMAARCMAPETYFAFIDVLYKMQPNWAFVQNWKEVLSGYARQAGLSQEKFDACQKDQALFTGITQSAKLAGEKLGVQSTPTFFIAGQKYPGVLSAQDLDKILGPLTK
jgi:protein-disulfide isomerase